MFPASLYLRIKSISALNGSRPFGREHYVTEIKPRLVPILRYTVDADSGKAVYAVLSPGAEFSWEAFNEFAHFDGFADPARHYELWPHLRVAVDTAMSQVTDLLLSKIDDLSLTHAQYWDLGNLVYRNIWSADPYGRDRVTKPVGTGCSALNLKLKEALRAYIDADWRLEERNELDGEGEAKDGVGVTVHEFAKLNSLAALALEHSVVEIFARNVDFGFMVSLSHCDRDSPDTLHTEFAHRLPSSYDDLFSRQNTAITSFGSNTYR